MIVEQKIYRFKCERCGKLSKDFSNKEYLCEYKDHWLHNDHTYCPQCMSDVNREEEVKELEENE